MNDDVKRVRGRLGTPTVSETHLSWKFPDGHSVSVALAELSPEICKRFFELGAMTKLRGLVASAPSALHAEKELSEAFAFLVAGKWRRPTSNGVDGERLALAIQAAKGHAGVQISVEEARAKVAAWDEGKRKEVLRTYPEVARVYAPGPDLDGL